MSALVLLAAAHGAASTAQDVSIGHVLLQMVVSLVVVVGGIWGLGKILRRSPRGRRAGAGGRARGLELGCKVLSRQPVGKGKSIAVVQAGGQCFLVGIADSGLTPLGELRPAGSGTDDDDAVTRAGRRPEVEGAGASSMALAPFDLGSIDLSALSGATADAETGAVPAGAVPAGAVPAVVASGRREPPSVRTWLNALREATIRR